MLTRYTYASEWDNHLDPNDDGEWVLFKDVVDLRRIPVGICGVDMDPGDSPCGEMVYYDLENDHIICGCCTEGSEPVTWDPKDMMERLRKILKEIV